MTHLLDKATDVEVLHAAIDQAIKNGWAKPIHGFKVWLPVASLEPLVILYEDFDTQVQCNYEAVIFSHEFCKALWGAESGETISFEYHSASMESRNPLVGGGTIPIYIHHMQEMVTSGDRIDYLRKHLDV